MHIFEVHSNESACKKGGRLGLDQVITVNNKRVVFEVRSSIKVATPPLSGLGPTLRLPGYSSVLT